MTASFFPAIRINAHKGNPTLTKAQKQFNTLVKKIESLKAQLEEWQDKVPRQNESLRREYELQFKAYNTLRVELVQFLDRAYSEKRLSKNERKKLRHLIPTLTVELMNGQPSDVIKEIHDKYSDVSYDEQDDVADEAVRSMMEDVFGFEIGDDIDINDPEQVRAFIEQQARDKRARLEESLNPADERQSKRKKSARQDNPEQSNQSEAVQVQKSLQEIFRKLVGALHPDRAPNETERERRTELMQRVNVAYEKKDLLQLLELQAQIEQVGYPTISAQTDERLKHYNKLLKEQCAVLMQALDETQLPFRFQLGLSPYTRLSAKQFIAHMQHDIQSLQQSISALRGDLHLIQDTVHLKAWLRDYEISKEPEFDDFMDEFSMSPFAAR